jgi:hypothetical protein
MISKAMDNIRSRVEKLIDRKFEAPELLLLQTNRPPLESWKTGSEKLGSVKLEPEKLESEKLESEKLGSAALSGNL